jgi:uncharacterized PurR-regulated membrane protein YhhQ (DUF165 family)
MLWPLEFVMTDIVNEYYGPKAVRRISFTAIALISYAFLMFYAAIHVPAADFWITSGRKIIYQICRMLLMGYLGRE